MKVFISWSGELSKKVAKVLNEWLPCIDHSIEPFFSPEDIEKGENWEKCLTGELADSKYGIICLAPDNVSAPWLHFEAGAISQAFDSRIATLMINIVPSDIKGPLSRFQATKLEYDDFWKLISGINSNNEKKTDENVLKRTFDGLWDKIKRELDSAIAAHSTVTKPEKKTADRPQNDAAEEILQLVRKHDSMLSKIIEAKGGEITAEDSGYNTAFVDAFLGQVLFFIENWVEYLRYGTSVAGGKEMLIKYKNFNYAIHVLFCSFATRILSSMETLTEKTSNRVSIKRLRRACEEVLEFDKEHKFESEKHCD